MDNLNITQVLSIVAPIIITVIVSAYYIHRDIVSDMKIQTSRVDAANARIDQLHVMFYELLREVKK